jgi:hypothetical protein
MSKGFAELQLKRISGMAGPTGITEPSQLTPNDNTNNTQHQQVQN